MHHSNAEADGKLQMLMIHRCTWLALHLLALIRFSEINGKMMTTVWRRLQIDPIHRVTTTGLLRQHQLLLDHHKSLTIHHKLQMNQQQEKSTSMDCQLA